MIPVLTCSVCALPVTVGDKVIFTCVGFDEDQEPIVNTVHQNCVDHEVKVATSDW